MKLRLKTRHKIFEMLVTGFCLSVIAVMILILITSVNNTPSHYIIRTDLPEEFPIVEVGDKLSVYKIDTLENIIIVHLGFDHSKQEQEKQR